jgi:ketosteroid isomerase-like protein
MVALIMTVCYVPFEEMKDLTIGCWCGDYEYEYQGSKRTGYGRGKYEALMYIAAQYSHPQFLITFSRPRTIYPEPSTMANNADVRALFEPLSVQGRQQETIGLVADDVDWTIMGHSPMSRKYNGKQDFVDNTLKVLRERVLTEPLRLEVRNVVGTLDGEGDDIHGEVAVELAAIEAVCKNGLKYDMVYVWVCKFQKGKIVRVRAYIDSDLLRRAMEQNP